MPMGAADVLRAAGDQGPIVVVAVFFGLFMLGYTLQQTRRDATRDRAMASMGKSHEATMQGAYELMRHQGQAHIEKMEGVLKLVADTVRANNTERSMDAREMTAALHDYKSVVLRATTVLERISPTGPNGKTPG
jgi:hypothetical protein